MNITSVKQQLDDCTRLTDKCIDTKGHPELHVWLMNNIGINEND